MIWIIPAFVSAISQSTADLLSKKNLQGREEYTVAFYLFFLAIPFVLIMLIFVGIPSIGSEFFIALVIGGSLNTFATIFYIRAIKLSPLSVTIPMLSFTPVFMLLTSPLILNEHPSSTGIYGISLISIGAYLLNFEKFDRSLFHPFKMITVEKGIPLMLLVAFIYSVAANFDKIGVIASNFVFWILATNIFLAISLGVIMLIKVPESLKMVKQNIKSLLPMGISEAVSQIATVAAMMFTLVPYVIAIKRTSILFSSAYGFTILKEKNVIRRATSISVMMLGIFILTFVK